MTEPRFLPDLKKVNDLPYSQHCLKHLKALKLPVDHQELYCLQLLEWAQKNHKLDLDSELLEALPLMWDWSPNRVARVLRLEALTPSNGPQSTAQDMAYEISDRALGIEPEEV